MKKYKFRAACLMLCLCLVYGITGCGNWNSMLIKEQRQSNTKIKTIRLWHIWTSDSDMNKESFEAAAKAFTSKNPNIRLEVEATETEIYKAKLRAAMAANEGPDVFYSWGGGFSRPFAASGKVLALDPYLNNATKDRLLPGALENLTYDGKVYGFPFMRFVVCLFANKEMFDTNGIKLPDTYDELLAASREFRAKGITPINVAEIELWPGILWYDAFALRTAGAQVSIDALGKKTTFDQAVFIDAAEKLTTLVNAGAFDVNRMKTGYTGAINPVIAGRVPMILMGSWACSSFESGTSQVKGKMVPLKIPYITGGKGGMYEYLGGAVDSWMVSANTENKDEAVTAAMGIAENLSKEGYERNMLLPVWKVKADETKVSPLMKQIGRMLDSGTAFVPAWDTYLEVEGAKKHLELVAELFSGAITPQTFAREMETLNMR